MASSAAQEGLLSSTWRLKVSSSSTEVQKIMLVDHLD